MKKRSWIFCIILVFLIAASCMISLYAQKKEKGQKCSNKFYFEFDTYGDLYSKDLTIGDTTVIKLPGSIVYNIKFFNCKGKSEFEKFEKGKKLIQGEYSGNDKVISDTLFTTDFATDSTTSEILLIREPLKNGKWTFFNNSGVLIKEENWNEGVLNSTVNISKINNENKK